MSGHANFAPIGHNIPPSRDTPPRITPTPAPPPGSPPATTSAFCKSSFAPNPEKIH